MSSQTKTQPISKSQGIEKVYLWLIVVVFGGIVLHAPLSVFLGTLLPDYDLLLKSWKEILLVVASVIAAMIIQRRKLWQGLWDDLIVKLALSYAGLHIVLAGLLWQGPLVTIAGLMIDLRYILFFLLVYLLVVIMPQARRLIVTVVALGGLLVAVFALLQVTVLPKDILANIGYDKDVTIAPYLTVDQNPDYIRINSTLRGPNPLGAYAVIILSLLVAYLIKKRRAFDAIGRITIGMLAVGSTVALWASYSRSALVAAGSALAVIALATVGRRLSRRAWIITVAVLFALLGGLLAARDTSFVSHVILHENPAEGNDVNSNDGHIESLIDGTDRMVRQPLGAGVGSTGSASLLGDEPLIIENQYLFIAHESGWLGLLLFVVILAEIMRRLWLRREDWLALGVFASGLGLALIGLLLPVWVDETVALVWWGLAAVALGVKERYDGQSTNKKTA